MIWNGEMGAHTNNYEIPIKIDYYITLILYVGTYTYRFYSYLYDSLLFIDYSDILIMSVRHN